MPYARRLVVDLRQSGRGTVSHRRIPASQPTHAFIGELTTPERGSVGSSLLLDTPVACSSNRDVATRCARLVPSAGVSWRDILLSASTNRIRQFCRRGVHATWPSWSWWSVESSSGPRVRRASEATPTSPGRPLCYRRSRTIYARAHTPQTGFNIDVRITTLLATPPGSPLWRDRPVS
jgi:hypothetical protein